MMEVMFVGVAVAIYSYVEIIPTRQPFDGSQLPAASKWTRFPAASAWQAVPAEGGVVVATSTDLFFAHADKKANWWRVRLTDSANRTISSDEGMRLVKRAESIVAIVTSRMLHRVTHCTLGGSGSTCTIHDTVAIGLGLVHAATATANAVWLASENGLFRCRDGARAATRLLDDNVVATASSGKGLVAAGNSERLWLLDETSGAVVRWEWVSDVPSGQGGVIGDAIRALAWGAPLLQGDPGSSGNDGDSAPSLFVGTQSCINVRDANGAFVRVDADDGLPVSNVTSIAAASGPNGTHQLWVGTTYGVALWDKSEPQWRYLYGARWLVGSHVRSIAVVGEAAVVVSDGGVTWLMQVNYTLARKAEVMEAILPRHDRHGLVAECQMASFGDVDESCFNTDNDNNGLWTSLVVCAEYMRYAVTRSPAALAAASRHLRGMALLHEITGGVGFPARSACAPSELTDNPPRCGGGIHDRTRWVNSTVPQARTRTPSLPTAPPAGCGSDIERSLQACCRHLPRCPHAGCVRCPPDGCVPAHPPTRPPAARAVRRLDLED